MAVHRIGYQTPRSEIGDRVISRTGVNPDTGMEWETFESKGWEGTYLVAVDHEDVGLVTWYRAHSEDELDRFITALETAETYGV